jgi:hypothetical protein
MARFPKHQSPTPVQILPDVKNGRHNTNIWNRVNFTMNTNHAIARRLGCDETSVAYQRAKRGIPAKQQGGRHREGYREFTPGQMRRRGIGPLPFGKIVL